MFRWLVLVPCFGLVAAMAWLVDWQAMALYGAASLLCGLMFWRDKRLAEAGRSRISEQSLQVVAFLGGWPGALIVGQLIRHKTRKLSFRQPLWGTVWTHMVLWVWLVNTNQTLFSFLASLSALLARGFR